MFVNSLAYGWSIVASIVCGFYLFCQAKSYRRDSAENNSDFRRLQKIFVPPYLAVLFSESLQAPYLFVLYYHYQFDKTQIGALYVVGLLTTVIVVILCNLSTRLGRRLLCLLCVMAGSLGCLFKFFDSFLLLLIGRVLDGIFTALVTTPFQNWYTHEHLAVYDFPAEWLPSSFAIVSVGAGALAVAAGYIAEFAEATTRVTAFPFAIAIVFLVLAGFAIGSLWGENAADEAPTPIGQLLQKTLQAARSRPLVLCLCAVSLLSDSAIQLIAFVWSPIFVHARYHGGDNVSFGVVYSALLSSSLAGSLIFSSSLFRRIPISRSLSLSLLLCLVTLLSVHSLLPDFLPQWKSTRFDKVLAHLIVLHFAIGIYTPAMNRLQFDLFPSSHRSSLLAFLRVPLTLIVSCYILFAYPTTLGESTIITVATILFLFPAVMATLVDLYLFFRGKATTQVPDHFIVPQRQPVVPNGI